jgi:hypothetical protein
VLAEPEDFAYMALSAKSFKITRPISPDGLIYREASFFWAR